LPGGFLSEERPGKPFLWKKAAIDPGRPNRGIFSDRKKAAWLPLKEPKKRINHTL
jgi:hypothetical protein